MNCRELRALLQYDPDTGSFTWLIQPSRGVKAGSIAGVTNGQGYRHIQIKGKAYKASRLAWLYMTGEWPEDLVDHANRNRSDDRWINLRSASRSENSCNSATYKNNICGLKGVTKFVRGNYVKWRSRIHVQGRQIHLGYFDTPQEAHAAYISKSQSAHGEFSCQM